MKEESKMNKSRYVVIAERVASKYQDLGHAIGDKMWWLDNSGKVQTKVFDGRNFHHDISRLDMDLRWRGRLDSRGVATLLPPVRLYSRYDAEDMPLPNSTMNVLEKMGAKVFYLDTTKGLARVARKK
jgi:hypothetical protein